MSGLSKEAQRLARKIWPDRDWELWGDGQVHLSSRPWSAAANVMCPPMESGHARRDLCRRAEIAALRVLAGENEIDAGHPSREVLDFVRLCVQLRNTDGSDEESVQSAALEWLESLDSLRPVPNSSRGSKRPPVGDPAFGWSDGEDREFARKLAEANRAK